MRRRLRGRRHPRILFQFSGGQSPVDQKRELQGQLVRITRPSGRGLVLKIGLIGPGRMGAPICAHLAAP